MRQPYVDAKSDLLENRRIKLKHKLATIDTSDFLLYIFMQLGFYFLKGSVMSKNTKSIMLKNLLDTFAGGLVWYLVGFYVFLYFGVPESPSMASVVENGDSSTPHCFCKHLLLQIVLAQSPVAVPQVG